MASALSSTVWIASVTSVLVMAMIASRSLTSSRPRISWSVAMMVLLEVDRDLVGWIGRRGRVGRDGEGTDHAVQDAVPPGGLGAGPADGLEQQEPETDGMGEVDDRRGVERRVDRTGLLGRLDQLAQSVGATGEVPAQHGRDLGVA